MGIGEKFMLSKQAIEEFQTIYRKTFGQDIDLLDAERKGIALIRLYKIVLKTKNSPQSTPRSNQNGTT